MRLALLLAVLAPAALAQEAPPAEVALTPTAGQNFAASAEGPLLIVGDEARYDIVLPADILFDFDESTLRPDAQPLLDQLAAHFATHRADQVHVRGHTDAKGSDQYNLSLSVNRATAVCDWLKANTALAVTNCIGRGEMEPAAPNENADGTDNPEGRQLNRRVTISVVVYPDVDALLGENADAAAAALDTLGDVDAGAMLDEAEAQAEGAP